MDDDVNKLAEVAVAPEGVTTLLKATGGDPNRSLRYRELLKPYGLDQELIAAFRTEQAWEPSRSTASRQGPSSTPRRCSS